MRRKLLEWRDGMSFNVSADTVCFNHATAWADMGYSRQGWWRNSDNGAAGIITRRAGPGRSGRDACRREQWQGKEKTGT